MFRFEVAAGSVIEHDSFIWTQISNRITALIQAGPSDQFTGYQAAHPRHDVAIFSSFGCFAQWPKVMVSSCASSDQGVIAAVTQLSRTALEFGVNDSLRGPSEFFS